VRVRVRLLLALAAAGALGCATGGKLRGNAEVIRADLEKARQSGAQRCTPKDLALAEAHLDFGVSDIDRGDGTSASRNLSLAEQYVRRALELSKSCGPAQVTIRAPKEAAREAPRKAVIIAAVDSDGDGVPDAEDKCPTVPGPKENAGCPLAKDSDGDGIPDDIDRCPLDPEDFDGFQDEDGCPDPDNDGDGIVDKLDACPNTPGPVENRGCPVMDRDGDGVPDNEDKCPDQPGPKENFGCPDTDRDHDGIPDRLDKCPDDPGLPPDGCPKKYALVEIKRDRILIKQQVHFASARYKVLPDSFKLLDQVALVLRDYPSMKVAVEGHTDTVGPEAMNMKLSQARADDVKAYLVRKGVSEDRLEAVGYGPTKPIASNKTELGRSQNRRTEFRIVAMQ
jgi:outer membrane protein OmpA-like peptidoglycan-associated protein